MKKTRYTIILVTMFVSFFLLAPAVNAEGHHPNAGDIAHFFLAPLLAPFFWGWHPHHQPPEPGPYYHPHEPGPPHHWPDEPDWHHEPPGPGPHPPHPGPHPHPFDHDPGEPPWDVH